MSRRSKSGCSTISRDIMGTPTKVSTRSRSMVSSASAAFHLCWRMIRPPAAEIGCRQQLQPVTWNSGTESSATGAVFRGRFGGRLRIGPRHGHQGVEEAQVHDVGDDTPLGHHGALGKAGGPRRVEDADVVVRARSRLPGARSAGVATASCQGVAPSAASSDARTDNDLEGVRGAHRRQVRRQGGEAIGIGEEQLRRGVREGVLHLGARPPGVHAHGHGADGHGGPVAERPLGVVAHGDAHAVAVAHAARLQEGGECRDLPMGLRVADALVLVRQVRSRPVGGRRREERPQGRRRGVVAARRDAAHVDDGPRERRALRRQLLPGLAHHLVHGSLLIDAGGASGSGAVDGPHQDVRQPGALLAAVTEKAPARAGCA